MSLKESVLRSMAREKVLRGAGALADAVRGTLGPRPRCALIERRWSRPLVCDDGLTIAKEIALKDPEENLGAQMMREAAERTGAAVGDGTTASIVLAHALVSEGLRAVSAGASAVGLKRGLERGLRTAVAALRAQSRPVQSRREAAQVAALSGRNDPALGELVAEAFARVGLRGVVSVEEAEGAETAIEQAQGLRFDRGYLSAYLVTDPERMEAVLPNARILLCDKKIGALKDLLPLLEEVARARLPLLLVAADVDSEALAALVVNKVRGALACAAVKAPGDGSRRQALLQDLAVLTGAQVVSEGLGATLDRLGRARRVVVDREATTLIECRGDRRAIEGRRAEIRGRLEGATSDQERAHLQERLARLSGAVALIRVGARSEAERRSRKEAIEDAIGATRAALAEGFVPGGGLALLRAIDALQEDEAACPGDERKGLRVLERALAVPTRQLAENSAADAGVVVERMRRGSGSHGFDAARGDYVDLIEAGIIDPTKVVRLALENAVSVAGVLLLTQATLTDLPRPRRGAAAGLTERP